MLIQAHSGLRYLVLLAGIIALAYALFGLLTRRPYDSRMSTLASTFAGLLHVQLLMGLGVLFSGRFEAALIGHIFMMFFAAVAAQVTSSVMRRRPEAERSWGPHVVGITLALALVAGGILAIQRPILGFL